MRESRKMDHLKFAMLLPDGPGATGFDDLQLVHNCLPNLSAKDISLNGSIAGIAFEHPLIINAITGGAADVTVVNAELAKFAQQTRSIMAVGSQYGALANPALRESFAIVRKIYQDGLFWANIGAYATVEEAQAAVDMIGACALQIHLNPGQEAVMPEGDRDYRGYLDNIARIAAAVSVPVIVKEVGCGIAREQAEQLLKAGIRVVDVGGTGGTNFLAIENSRRLQPLTTSELSWGIPTAVSAVEVASAILPASGQLIVSGGIRTALDVVKALSLGATAVGIAGPVLRCIRSEGTVAAIQWFEELQESIQRYLLLLGAATPVDLQHVPVVIGGASRNWLEARGIDTSRFARRSK
ncbi:MAG TPA: type 2 isopentenyl-diphosphate Delta-isomerase [Patescibacteria group bacterium]|nr:type 2 isopentenyl-diphosphate Delta-isomerase [Patescibacteria group bacterium]